MLDHSDLGALFAPFQSALGPYRDRLAVSLVENEVELMPASALLDQPALSAAIEQARQVYRAPDLHVAASLWNKHYNAALLPGVLSAMTLLGVSVNAAIANTSIVVRDGLPMALWVHDLTDIAVYRQRLRFGT